MIISIAIGFALIVPLVFLGIIRRFDLFGTGKYSRNFATLLWGIVAYILAAQINTSIITADWATRDQVIRIAAPIIEEILKAIILIYLIQRADFNYIVDGAIYGFGAGIGFAIIENYEYITGHPEIALTVAVARVFSTNLIHATGSAMIGTVLAYRRGDQSTKGWVYTLLGFTFSILFHMGFNTMVSAGAFLIFAFAVGFIGVGLIVLIIKQGMNTQKVWLTEKLDDINRVTKNELKALNTIEKLDMLLEPIRVQFGSEKVNKVKAMLGKQAEIGIKLKLLDSTPNKKKKQEIGEVIDGLRADMDLLRNEIGSYCMMFVRSVYMNMDTKIWDTINTRIDESRTGQKGGGLWDRANTKIKDSPNPQEEEQS